MPIKFSKKIDFKKTINEIQNNLKRGLEIAITDEVTEIITRTEQGKEVENRPFEPYVAAYKKYRIKKGRRGTPDLTFTGNMLRSITSSVEVTTAKLIGRIFFSSAKEAEKAGFNQQKRQFFGLSKEQLQRIKQRLKEALKK